MSASRFPTWYRCSVMMLSLPARRARRLFAGVRADPYCRRTAAGFVEASLARQEAPPVTWTFRMNARSCIAVAALALAAAVALGAFGAHALKLRLAAEMLTTYQTAVQYHFWHALGLLGVGVLMMRSPDSRVLAWVAWLLVAGLV